MSVQQQIDGLREQLRKHDHAYYVLARPTVSDQEYDALMRQLIELETQHPELRTPDSPSQRVGGEPIDKFASREHGVPMMSIDNTYEEADFRSFDARVRERLGVDEVTYVVEPKIDGLACNLRYEDGVLVYALTRGDGRRGDDVTVNVKTIRSIPLVLHRNATPISSDEPSHAATKRKRSSKESHETDAALFDVAPAISPRIPKVIEIRGEVFMDNAVFQAINAKQIEAGEEPYANPRNFTAGTLKQLDPKITASRRLRFAAHGIGELEGMGEADSYFDLMRVLNSFGIPVPEHAKRVVGVEAAWREIERFKVTRGTLDYQTDGMVIKVDSREQRESLGVTSKAPRWVIAFKYPAEQVQTILEDVVWQVGKNGTLTPVAHLTAVFVAGSTVRRSTLHNAEQIERLDLRIGDTIVLEKAGEVIPQVVQPVLEKRPHGARRVKPPTKCPACGEPVVKDPDSPYIRCINPDCPAQLKQRLEWFAGRKQMNIDGLGEKLVEQLVDSGKVKSIPDLYRLTVEDLTALSSETISRGKTVVRHVGEKTATAIIANLEASKANSLDLVLAGLGIRHLGNTTAADLARAFGDVDSMLDASLADLQRAISDAEDLDDREEKARELARAIHEGFAEARKAHKRSRTDVQPDELPEHIRKLGADAGLGRSVSVKRAETLAEHFDSLDALLKADESEIYRALRTDLVVAAELHTFFQSDAARELFRDLKKVGLSMKAKRAPRAASGGASLAGKSIVVTGTLERLDRVEIETLIRDLGGKASGSVSSKTAFLVAGENAGSKLAKAKELGVEVIDEAEFLKRVGRV